MILSKEEANFFFELYYNLLLFTNRQRRIIPRVFTTSGLRKLPSEQLKSIRRVLFDQSHLIDQFISKNPANFSDFKLEIIYSWKRAVPGRFFMFKEMETVTIFLSNLRPSRAYGVVGLAKEFCMIFPEPLPVYLGTVLLPFLNKIITDGIFSRYRLEFGTGFQHNLRKSYDQAIEETGIIYSL